MRLARLLLCAAPLVSPLALADEAAAPSAAARNEGRRLMEAGKEAFRQQQLDEAASLFAAAHAADPTLLIALYNRAFSLRKGGKLAEARTAYLEFLARAPDDLDGLFGLAETERLLGADERAAQRFEAYATREARPGKERYSAYAKEQAAGLRARLAKAEPQQAAAGSGPSALIREANKAYAAKRFAGAAELYRRAYEQAPSDSHALYKSALSLRKAGQLKAAREAYETFLAAAPDDADGTYGLAETLRLLDEKEAAAGHFERYVEVEARPSEARFVARARMLAEYLRQELEKERLATAAAPPDAAVAPDAPVPAAPDAPVPAAPDAPVPAALDAPVPAAPDAPVPAAPDTPGPAAQAPPVAVLPARPAPVGAGPNDAHRSSLGLALAARGLSREPEDIRTLEVRYEAAVAAVGGDAARARPAAPSEASRARARQYVEEGRAFLRAGDAGAAAAQAKRALGLVPRDLEALLLFGAAHLELDEDAAAERAFVQALAAWPDSSRPLWALARLHEQRGFSTDARRYYRLYVDSTAPDRDEALVKKAEATLTLPEVP